MMAMDTVSLHDAKARLSELVRRAETGEQIALTRHGRVVARIVPSGPPLRIPGLGRGTVEYVGDFEFTDEEIDEMFYGPIFPDGD